MTCAAHSCELSVHHQLNYYKAICNVQWARALHNVCDVQSLPGLKALFTLQNQVRYREGQVVTAKGEKYVVEKAGQDWDGGSKGKVFTKGKRGKGTV